MDKEITTKVIYGSHSFISLSNGHTEIINNKELRNGEHKPNLRYSQGLMSFLREAHPRKQKKRVKILLSYLQMEKSKFKESSFCYSKYIIGKEIEEAVSMLSIEDLELKDYFLLDNYLDEINRFTRTKKYIFLVDDYLKEINKIRDSIQRT